MDSSMAIPIIVGKPGQQETFIVSPKVQLNCDMLAGVANGSIITGTTARAFKSLIAHLEGDEAFKTLARTSGEDLIATMVETWILAQKLDLHHVQNRLIERFRDWYNSRSVREEQVPIEVEAFDYIRDNFQPEANPKIEWFILAYYAGLLGLKLGDAEGLKQLRGDTVAKLEKAASEHVLDGKDEIKNSIEVFKIIPERPREHNPRAHGLQVITMPQTPVALPAQLPRPSNVRPNTPYENGPGFGAYGPTPQVVVNVNGATQHASRHLRSVSSQVGSQTSTGSSLTAEALHRLDAEDGNQYQNLNAMLGRMNLDGTPQVDHQGAPSVPGSFVTALEAPRYPHTGGSRRRPSVRTPQSPPPRYPPAAYAETVIGSDAPSIMSLRQHVEERRGLASPYRPSHNRAPSRYPASQAGSVAPTVMSLEDYRAQRRELVSPSVASTLRPEDSYSSVGGPAWNGTDSRDHLHRHVSGAYRYVPQRGGRR